MDKKVAVPDKDRILGLAVVAPLVGYLCLYLLLGFYAHPSADDFSYANKVFEEGFLNSQVSWYVTWSGRYASTALISAYITALDVTRHYWTLPALLLLATCSSFIALFISLPRRVLSLFQGLCAGMILTALYLSGVPSTSQIIYWLAGGVTYLGGNCLYLLLLAALIRIYSVDGARAGMTFWTAFLLVLANAGMNETIMFLQSLTLALAVLHGFAKSLRQRYLLLALLLASLAGAAAVILAPGNAVRSQYFPLAHDLFFSLRHSTVFAAGRFLSWSASPSLWLATLLWLPFASKRLRGNDATKPQVTTVAAAVIVWLSLLVAMNFPAYWSMGSPPPPRTVGTCFLVFIIGWFAMGTFIAAYIPPDRITFSAKCLRLASVALGGSLFATGNGAIAISDVSIAPTYSAELKARYEMIREGRSKGVADIMVPALQEFPQTIRFTDITLQKDHWTNQSYAKFFRVRSIATMGNSGS